MTRIIITFSSFAASLALIAALACGPAMAAWPIYGHDIANSRSADSAGPARSQVQSLQRAWTFDSSNGDFTGTPVVAGGMLVAGTNLGSIYALDPATGKTRWSRDVGQPINGTAAIDPDAPGGPTVFVPVAHPGAPRLLALSLRTGAVRWNRVLTRQPGSDVFGSPTYWRGTVYIGTSGPGNDESTARGSVVALREATGKRRWQTFTVPPGHDGGAVWSTPAIDSSTGRLYVGTGNAYHRPAAGTTDAMLVLSASSGRILGHFQSIPGDVWEADDPTGGPDYDFGASPNLIRGRDGRRLVGEGQKSGTYWALDRATMRPVWHKAVGPGSQFDGGINSTAYDGARIYGSDAIDGQVFALGRGGSIQWNSFDTGTLHFSPVALGNGVAYSADSDGFLTARDAATGKVLSKIPLGHPTFGGISVAGRAVYVAIGIGPPSPAQPIPGIDTSQMDGSGSIVAFRDTSPSDRESLRTSNPTFSGSCQLSGHVRFKPPLTNSPQNGRVRGRLRGRCSGTLTGAHGREQSIRGRVVKARVRSHGLESCGAGRGKGAGYLAFGRRRIRFTYSEVRAGPALTLKADGATGGSAVVEGNVSPSADPAAIAQACGGPGLRRAPVDVRLTTAPAISG
ncbi:MAG: PQQ-binding-like beta-propeller repeat protein [Solirubrobacterales bacterium]